MLEGIEAAYLCRFSYIQSTTSYLFLLTFSPPVQDFEAYLSATAPEARPVAFLRTVNAHDYKHVCAVFQQMSGERDTVSESAFEDWCCQVQIVGAQNVLADANMRFSVQAAVAAQATQDAEGARQDAEAAVSMRLKLELQQLEKTQEACRTSAEVLQFSAALVAQAEDAQTSMVLAAAGADGSQMKVGITMSEVEPQATATEVLPVLNVTRA